MARRPRVTWTSARSPSTRRSRAPSHSGDASALADLDVELGDDLLAAVHALPELGRMMPHPAESRLIRAEDPFGVRYWIARWDGQVEWAP